MPVSDIGPLCARIPGFGDRTPVPVTLGESDAERLDEFF
jgi:hypothetical protein